MPFFAVNYAYSSDSTALDEKRLAHRKYLGSLVDSGLLRASGPMLGGDPSALLLFRADSEQHVLSLLEDDPFQRAGLVEHTTVQEWSPLLGAFASES